MSKYKTVMNAAEQKRLADNRLKAKMNREARAQRKQPFDFTKNINRERTRAK